MSKKARPFDRRRSRAKRRRTEAAQARAAGKNRARALARFASDRAERAANYERCKVADHGRSAHFAAAQVAAEGLG